MVERAEAVHGQAVARGLAMTRNVPSIWSFLVVDAAGFAALFTIFLIERLQQPSAFSASANLLDARFGLANTLILLTSGALVAQAMHAVRTEDHQAARRWLAIAIFVGSFFAVVKIFEYYHDLEHEILPWNSDFNSFYFIITGIHFIHYIVGMAVLMVSYQNIGYNIIENKNFEFIESSILYWHLVDIIWIMIFPITYSKYPI